MNKPLGNRSAEKRVLWEVRQKYNVDKPVAAVRRTNRPTTDAPSNTPPPREVTTRERSRPRRHWGRRILFVLFLILILSGGVFGYKILAAGNKISTTDRSLLGQLTDLLFSQGKQLNGEADGRINILLIAIGGEGHQGQNLADTIMIASIHPQDGQVALLSIPRDLYVQVPGEEYYSKINAVHAYGEAKKAGDGPNTLRKKVEEVTGLPIHYYARIDFQGFKQIIDAVGGVNITIPNTFFDYWHKIAFSAGTEKMDGERALAYVRARYIEGPEGGDFKRAARQQQVLLALREKVFSVNTALDFTALNSILDSVSGNIRTDLAIWEMKRMYEVARQVNQEAITSHILTTGPSGVLVGTTEVLGGTPASVLKTRTGDYSEIKSIAANMFTPDSSSKLTASHTPPPEEPTNTPAPDEPAASPSSSPEKEAEKPTIEIRNGTNITGLAKKMSDELTTKDYEVLTIGNATNREVAKTTVYILEDSAEAEGQAVATYLSATTSSGLPGEEASSKAQLLIILGADAQ